MWRTTLGQVRNADDAHSFIKPADEHKGFAGQMVSCFADLLQTAALPDEMAVWQSEPIANLVSEFRVYVLSGRILGVKHYAGDFARPPALDEIHAMIEAFVDAPAAYSLDVGVAASQTLLIEVNDAFALGNYGLASTLYAQMIEARWVEMVRPCR